MVAGVWGLPNKTLREAGLILFFLWPAWPERKRYFAGGGLFSARGPHLIVGSGRAAWGFFSGPARHGSGGEPGDRREPGGGGFYGSGGWPNAATGAGASVAQTDQREG